MYFHLARWSAVSTRLTDSEHWLAWAQGRLKPETLPETRPELAFLPAMQRRRLGLSARLMFQAAHEAAAGCCCPTVFVSHDGEINRSFELWQTLLRDNSVSPTSFGLSVHNALVGQWSMHRQDMNENTALAARCGGWETAVLEAVALLAEGAPQVLVVAADEPLADPLAVQRAPFAYAVAALIEAGDSVQLQHLPAQADDEPHYWGALDWVRRRYLQQSDFVQYHDGGAWRWRFAL